MHSGGVMFFTVINDLGGSESRKALFVRAETTIADYLVT